MRAGEVLDARNDFIVRLDDERFRGVINGFGLMEFGRSGGHRQTEQNTPLSEMLDNNMRFAECYRVTHDMSMVVQHAADQLDSLDRFDQHLAPSSAGFVAFDRPLPVLDIRGKTMLVHYLTWGQVAVQIGGEASLTDSIDGEVLGRPSSATLCVLYNDQWRQPDEVTQDMKENMTSEQFEDWMRVTGRWGMCGAHPFFFEQRLGPKMAMPEGEQQAKLLAEGFTPSEGTNPVRYLHALWLLMGQTVVRKDPEHVERPAARRAKKMRLPGQVTVVRLRREADTTRREGETDVEWAHRWVVKGHWRWAHVGPHHPLAQEISPGDYRARIYIFPFVKGPAGAPFKQTEKVYSLER